MKIYISKLDAAKRQLETAINFFFRSGDPVSIHSLTGAAFQILEDICLKKGVKSFHKETLEQIKENKRVEFSRRLSEAKNFFKHADKDPEGIIEFIPETTTFFLWDACNMYKVLTTDFPPLFQTFVLYFNLKNPEILTLSIEQRMGVKKATENFKLDVSNPSTFLQMIPLLEEMHYI